MARFGFVPSIPLIIPYSCALQNLLYDPRFKEFRLWRCGSREDPP